MLQTEAVIEVSTTSVFVSEFVYHSGVPMR